MSQPRGPEPQPGYGSPREARAQASAEKAYRKAQRPWYKKKRFIVPLATILLIVIISVANGGGGGSTTTPGGNAAAQDPSAPPAFPGATADDLVAEAGATVESDGLSLSATALTEGGSTLGETLCTSVIYNNGGDGAAPFSLIDWKLQDPNGTILNTGFTGSTNLLSSGEIAPGGTASGDVCFDAPQGSPSGQYVVLFDPTFRFSSERIAWLNAL
ncbi:hypothetical protein GCM10017691_16310 [Pseudonocardia petroleophila]|uniref:DUF4352 domain-containing protein n=1 Tax=Pseudonocardia petroleophila TaxID=37331 RepID=A0A7G7MHN8_9PSEU|nr:DUF4352 domain-containing protein [Pseudonocardia petroleophila]QNG52299.1 DUF4352 domain-containing protein [Pseudonocardia petroleophila]